MLDTNIIIYLLDPQSPWFAWSSGLVAASGADVCVSSVAIAEFVSKSAEGHDVVAFLRDLGATIEDFGVSAALRAGRAQAAYRAAGGKREKLLGDFLIGAHAVSRKLPLATRDPRPYRAYFPDLELITPETEHG